MWQGNTNGHTHTHTQSSFVDGQLHTVTTPECAARKRCNYPHCSCYHNHLIQLCIVPLCAYAVPSHPPPAIPPAPWYSAYSFDYVHSYCRVHCPHCRWCTTDAHHWRLIQMHTTEVLYFKQDWLLSSSSSPPPPPPPHQDKVSSSIVRNPQNQSNMSEKRRFFSGGVSLLQTWLTK